MPAAITLHSPLPASQLFVESLTLEEGLSQLGRLDLQLLSPLNTVPVNALLGKAVAVSLEDGEGHKRYLHGHVVRFGLGMARGRFHGYHAEVRIWPWFLTRTADCRIFQDLTVPEIVQLVCDDHPGIAQIKLSLMRTYRKWTYCVQYRESDFQFISRLLEHEGIYWHVEHAQDKHTLTLMDTASAHDPIGGEDTLRFIENAASAAPGQQYLSDWRFDTEIQTEAVALTSYDFERPLTDLAADASISIEHPEAGAERFDFQGDYLQTADGTQLAEDLLDAELSRFQRFTGAGHALHVQAGRTFTLKGHPRGDQNAKYLITRVKLHAQVGVFDGASTTFKAALEAIPAAQQFRAPRTTAKPVVQGPQTAVVVGPAGEEIFTDKYGRVKVQFHWDRRGKKDDKSSCWMRVSQPWAGKNYGAIYIPRIGQEVVVSFLEGDPDQPLITGRVYNADQMPPWNLPANATQSGVLTRSSKGGAYNNGNYILFEDKKGAEALSIHAERNYSRSVEVDAAHSIGNDETHIVGRDHKTTITNDQSLVVEKGNRQQFVNTGTDTVFVKGNSSFYSEGERSEYVKAKYDTFADAKRGEYIKADHELVVGGDHKFKAANTYCDVGAKYIASGGDFTFSATGKTSHISGGDHGLMAANFNFLTQGKVVFTAQKFDRTVFESNDVILGPNGSTYIGASSSTSVGSSKAFFMGQQSSATLGMSNATTLGMAMSNAIGMQISNSVGVGIANAIVSMGFSAVNMGTSGISLENNAMYLINAGGPGSAGAALEAGSVTAAGVASVGVSVLAGLVAAAAGVVSGIDLGIQAYKDINGLLDNSALSPATKARLQRILLMSGIGVAIPVVGPSAADMGSDWESSADGQAQLNQWVPSGPPPTAPAVTPPAPPAAPVPPATRPAH